MLSREIATALRGRTLTCELFPFSFSEFLSVHHIKPDKKMLYGKDRHLLSRLYESYFYSGDYPEIAFVPEESVKSRIFQDYFNTVFYRDLVERYRINNTELLRKWLNALMVNISSLVSFRKFENDFKSQGVKLSNTTLSSFARYIEEVFFGFFVEIFSESERKRQVNPRKFYLIDLGLHNYLTLKFSENKGRLLENLVFLELRRRGLQIYYYKTKRGYEVDFLVSGNDSLSLIQVCHDPANVETFDREKRVLLSGMKELGLSTGVILTNDTKNILTIKNHTIKLLPVREWLLFSEEAEAVGLKN